MQLSPQIATSRSSRRRFDRLHELSREHQRGHVRLRGGQVIPICRRRGELLWWPEAAITRTALGTAQSKTGDVAINLASGAVDVSDFLIVVFAGDTALASGFPVYRPTSGSDEVLTIDATATNSGNVVTSICSKKVNTASGATGRILIATVGGTDSRAANALKITGEAASPLDKISTGINSSLAATSGATASTTQADEILIGAIGWEGPVEDQDGTWQNSFNAGQQAGTTGGGATSNITVDEGYLIVSATGAYTAALTRTLNSRDWAAAIATYKAAVASVARPLPRSFVPIMRSANY